MQPLTFIIPYSNWPGPVNTNWGPTPGKYKLQAAAGKYKLTTGVTRNLDSLELRLPSPNSSVN